MATELYGGIARAQRYTTANGNPVTTAGFGTSVKVTRYASIGKTNYIQISNLGANPCRVYFDKESFDADGTDGFITVAALVGFYGGPASLEDGQEPRSQPLLYLRSVGGDTDIEVVFYHRRS